MSDAVRFPFIERSPAHGSFSVLPYLSITLQPNDVTVSSSGLLDTGATVNARQRCGRMMSSFGECKMRTITIDAETGPVFEAWDLAKREPVAVVSNGATIAIIMSPSEYERLTLHEQKPRQGGYMKGLFAGVDWDDVLASPACGFEEYVS